ncbi:hypothetical protein P7K49_001540, partial [Saguinus oedipus]
YRKRAKDQITSTHIPNTGLEQKKVIINRISPRDAAFVGRNPPVHNVALVVGWKGSDPLLGKYPSIQ